MSTENQVHLPWRSAATLLNTSSILLNVYDGISMAFPLICLRIMVNASERFHACDDSENGVNDHVWCSVANMWVWVYPHGGWEQRSEVRGKPLELVLSFHRIGSEDLAGHQPLWQVSTWWVISPAPQSNVCISNGKHKNNGQVTNFSILFLIFLMHAISFNCPVQLILGIIWLMLLIFI